MYETTIDVPQDGSDDDKFNGDLALLSGYLQEHYPNTVVHIRITKAQSYKSKYSPEMFKRVEDL